MSLQQSARDWVSVAALAHLGANIRRYEWLTYTGEVRHNSLGGVAYLRPLEGKVVDANEQFTLVKAGSNKFCVVLTSLLSEPVQLGAKIGLQFYQLRRFDGTAADGTQDPAEGGCRTLMLTGVETKIPVRWEGRYLGINERFQDSYQEIRNPYLRDLITQLEAIPVNGGMRRAVNVLVDAGATKLEFVDPPEQQSATTAPAIIATVSNNKLVGRIEIAYDRGSDTYRIRTEPSGHGEETQVSDVHVEELADALQLLVDDETWMQAKVTVLKPASKPKAKVIAPAAV